MIWVIVWVGFSILAGVVASQKGRSGAGFFFLALVLSPLIGLIAALVVSPNESNREQAALATGQSRKCPFCGELIRPEAIVCRFCGRELNQAPVLADKRCAACGETLPGSAVRCWKCGSVQPAG